MADASTDELHFEPAGPGNWNRDPVHFPRPVTRYWSEMHPEPFKTGTNNFARYYGLLIDGLQTSYVNGFAYNQVRPVPEEEIPARFQRADEVLAGKLWREQLREWDEERKPVGIAKHREIQAVDPDSLSDEELAAHLVRCRDHHAAMIVQHMSFTAGAMIPTGDFLAHVGDWTGLGHAELLGLLRGSASVSAGGSEELERLKTIADDPEAMRILASDGTDHIEPAEVLAQLRALGGETGAAVAGYLDLVGFRPLDGFDISEPGALELPDALVRSIRITLDGRDLAGADVSELTAQVRAQVPEEHRDEFDELLGEARLTYRLRDERGVYSDIWASGLMRRAALAAGRRVAARGAIDDPVHMVDASVDEMCALVTGTGGPSAEELAARARYRATHTQQDAPPFIGDPPQPPPDPSGLPPGIGRIMRATGIALDSLFGSSDAEHDHDVLRGLAASPGVYEGPARLIGGPSEFGRIQQGDVLLTPATTEAFNILLPLLGAIVTDNGGLLSHSAIVAREYGIPGVVGTREATARISDGTRVRVDGAAGEVTVL
ncbi:MAG TPA: PEP-utilizing enzyme [Acidimicrobiia bacterium]|nr:PEP-utilizing enzyme [Acidimicrobiia bacterium]